MNFDELKCSLDGRDYPVSRDISDFLDELSSVVNDINNDVFFYNFKLPGAQDMEIIEGAYDNLMPFAVESENGRNDIYCYDFEQEAYPKVVVFSDHAIVKRWDSPRIFINWLDHMAKERR